MTRTSAASATRVLLLLLLIYGMLQSHMVPGEPLAAAILEAAACVLLGTLLTFWQPSRS